jgi:sulfofructose kinase
MSGASGARTRAVPKILCAGIAVHDHVYRLDRFPVAGTKTRARQFVATGGGCAANAAVAIARLGGEAALAAPLGGPPGEDAIGDWILANLARERVDCTGVVRVCPARSPISAIFVDASGERLIVNERDERLSEARPADPERAVADCDALLVDNRFAEFVLPLCLAARAHGMPIVLDGDRPTRASDRLLRTCTHLVFAADGLRATAGCDDLDRALRSIGHAPDAFVAVTDGARGMLWLERGQPRQSPAHPVEVVDTLGAGDVFHGAFALALAERRTAVDALRFAAAAAAVKCTRFGGINGAPTRVEVEQFLTTSAGANGESAPAAQ